MTKPGKGSEGLGPLDNLNNPTTSSEKKDLSRILSQNSDKVRRDRLCAIEAYYGEMASKVLRETRENEELINEENNVEQFIKLEKEIIDLSKTIKRDLEQARTAIDNPLKAIYKEAIS